jgi:hypothetical protein
MRGQRRLDRLSDLRGRVGAPHATPGVGGFAGALRWAGVRGTPRQANVGRDDVVGVAMQQFGDFVGHRALNGRGDPKVARGAIDRLVQQGVNHAIPRRHAGELPEEKR